MRVLVGWDNAAEAELLGLYLNIGENTAVIHTEPEALLRAAQGEHWDVVLFSLALAEGERSFELFQRLRRAHPDCPVVGACLATEVFRVARFMTNGMRSYMLRDASGDFMFLVHATLEGVVEAVRAEREQKIAERLREEIESVRRLQESIIPHDLNCPLGYRIAARYEPSQIQVLGGQPVIMAGGDYYDVFRIDEHSMVILVGDASGHGMKACMSIFTMHTLVRMIRGERYQETASFVAEINRRLCEQSIIKDEGGFITLFYGILRADRHEFQWTSAGHPLPLLQHFVDGSVNSIGSREVTGLPLGLFSDAEYGSTTIPIPPQCRLLLYTDGLVEAIAEGDEDHREFGEAGVTKTLRQATKLPLPATLDALFQESSAFTRGTGRHDDTSVVLIERE
jgi:serine phosphatase RsbU (regulator of sigma subunit)/CheY-like chemotaxis protein